MITILTPSKGGRIFRVKLKFIQSYFCDEAFKKTFIRNRHGYWPSGGDIDPRVLIKLS